MSSKGLQIDPRLNYSVGSNKFWKKKEDNKCGLVLSVQKKKAPGTLTVDVPNI